MKNYIITGLINFMVSVFKFISSKIKIFIDMSDFICRFASQNTFKCRIQIEFLNRITDINRSSFLIPYVLRLVCFATARGDFGFSSKHNLIFY